MKPTVLFASPKYLTALRKELNHLENTSARLYNRAYKTRNEYASKDWKEYRKVYDKLKRVKKEIAVVYKMSQDTFNNIK